MTTSDLSPEFLHALVAVAGDEVVVDHADRLHEGVDDRRAAELEATRSELFRHGARCRGFRRNLTRGLIAVHLRLAINEIPQQLREARSLCRDFKPGARREHRALDLGAVAHDAGVLHQPFDFFWRVTRDFRRREIVEGAAKILALAQNGDPRQAGLKAVEHQFFVESAVVIFGHAPFFVMIGEVKRVILRPRAANERGICGSGHSAALEPSGKAKWAQSGLIGRTGTPPARNTSPRERASVTRSRRNSASP